MSTSLSVLLRLLAVALAAAGQPSQRQVLSEEPRIELSKSWLSQAEAALLRQLAESELLQDVGNPESGKTSVEIIGGEEWCALDLSDAEITPEDAQGWEVVRLFNERASTWLGQEPLELPVVIGRWEAWQDRSALNRSGPLHLDAHLHPWRQYTILTFLSGTGNAEADGSTVFPCIETDDMDAKEMSRRQKLCSRAARHLQSAHEKLLSVHAKGLEMPPSKQYAYLEEHPELTALAKEIDGVRPVNWIWNAHHDGVAADLATPQRAAPLHALAEEMCRGKAPGLRVSTREGTALLMEVQEPGQKVRAGWLPKPDWRLWHAGCSPKGSKRWTAQVFFDRKPLPRDDMKTEM